MVDLIDTNGVKPTLKKGVLGYDDYSVGGDAGRLYVGTGTASIAQAKKSELDSHTSNVSNPHSVTKTQVGLGSVDNTADINKNVLSATKLTTARNIAGTSFDGTADINILFANLSTKPTTISGYGITDAYTKTEIGTLTDFTTALG